MVAIPFSVSSAPGVSAQESAGRIVNAYPEVTEVGSPNKVIWRRAPGLDEVVSVPGRAHCRGFIAVGSTLLAVFNSAAVALTQSGDTLVSTDLGTMPGTRAVTIARNNATVPNIVAVDVDSGAYNLFPAATPSNFADVDLPASPLSVSSLNGYLLFVFGSGQIWSTDLNSVNVASNAFTTAQRRPGGLRRGVSYRGEFFAFGPSGCEVYRDVGASPFPLEFVTMIPRGIVGTFAVSGWEEGWSNELCWVGDDNVVYKLDGYSGTRISKHSVERTIEGSGSDRSLIECSVAMSGGHAFLFVKLPTEWTWVYDLTTGEWSERMSYNAVSFRGSCAVRAFDRWYMGDDGTGKIGEFTSSDAEEFGDPLAFEVQSGIPATFPSRGEIAQADFYFSVGVGTVDVPEPVAQISWSEDGGRTWGNPVNRKIGSANATNQRVTVNRIGLFGPQGIRFKIRVSDPVHVGFRGGEMALRELGA